MIGTPFVSSSTMGKELRCCISERQVIFMNFLLVRSGVASNVFSRIQSRRFLVSDAFGH
ncbi:hypothetical protein SCFA_20063 [anaerobic digester metagenome]|uniref:Uncharacterized protein n=1 Tax=anaerobic digester metagenome TaxID=1263854 RepID=A0A485LYV1_9ZZZZ